MERARSDEQNMVCFDHAMFGGDRGALDQRQQIALHAFTRDIAAAAFARTNLVNFIKKNNAVILDLKHRLAGDLVLINQLVAFLDHQRGESRPHRHAPRLAARGLAENIAQIDRPHRGPRRAGNFKHRHGVLAGLQLDLDFLVIELLGAQFFAETVTGQIAGCGPDQSIQNPLFCCELGPCLDLFAAFFAHHADADLDQITDDLFDIAPDITNLGEFRRLDL